MYKSGGASLFVYPSTYAGTNKATAVGFRVADLPATVTELKSRGVRFEEYDIPNVKTVNGVYTTPDGDAAWFKDSEGNIIGLFTGGM
jgi:hypothetical protein